MRAAALWSSRGPGARLRFCRGGAHDPCPQRRAVREGRAGPEPFGREDRPPRAPVPKARRQAALAAAAADRRDARRARPEPDLRRDAARLVRPGPDRPDQRQRARPDVGLPRHRPARPLRERTANAVLRLRSDRGRAAGDDPAEHLHALRRPRARIRQLRDAVPLVARRRDRGQLVPRLLRLRLRPRPLRHRPHDPREPLRARAAVRDGPLPVRAPGSRPALRRAAAARRGQPLRRLPRRRRPALPDEQRRPRDGREQRLRRHGRARARVPGADGDRARQQQVEAAAALREDPQQHDPDRLHGGGTATRARCG